MITQQQRMDTRDKVIGMEIISLLGLKMTDGRVDTDGGTKTAVGLCRSVRRIFEEYAESNDCRPRSCHG